MPRILALDVGEKTIGVAICDELETMALPGETILRQEGKKKDMAAIRQLVSDTKVIEIVVGLPLKLDGTAGIQAEKIEAFISLLRGSVRIPIFKQDERFSTGEAEKALMAANVRREKRKKTIDSMAACIILQTYMDKKRNRLESESEAALLHFNDEPEIPNA